ncbi:MAG: class I SAM-dependent methyltransferase [Solirubrobacteraceae bacterium]
MHAIKTEPTWVSLPLEQDEQEEAGPASLPVGVHLVGSVPLDSNGEVFRRVSKALGDRLRRIPDGETGPRSDWILWQYPVFSSRPQFEVGPPGADSYRRLPKLRLRDGERAEDVRFGALGYADTALASYREFARLKRDGMVPGHCRFQLCLPTPLAPISAFVDPEHQAALEPVYEARMLAELAQILAIVPHDQLALQWDARLEFAMLEGIAAPWFTEVRAGVLERLLRLSRAVPHDVELGFHLCYGDEAHGHFVEPGDSRKLVEVANALSASLDRPLNWIHMPVPHGRHDDAYFAPMRDLSLHPETELYLGLVHMGDGADGARRRIAAARRHVRGFGAATDCGWGRGGAAAVDGLLALHRELSAPVAQHGSAAGAFAWPEGFDAVPDEDWTHRDVDEAGLAYDHVDEHGWYSNLNATVEELAATLKDGDILLDYSGGTGILLDRLRLRIFERQVGMLIVDASAKFLRVAVEKYRGDPRFAARLLRFLKDEQRLESLDDVLGEQLRERGVDAIVSANAVHLYPDLDEVTAGWARALRSGGKVCINSGNLRNPRAAAGEWILDETVWVINDLAEGIVRSDDRYAAYRPVLDDAERMVAHAAQRDKVFLQPRPLELYTDALERAGLHVTDVREATIVADVQEWFELMTAYHDTVLGWVGGTKKLDGAPAPPEAVKDRLELMRHAIDTIFGGRTTFNACWTYITAQKAG